MRAAGVLVFAGGLEEDLGLAFHAGPSGDATVVVDGPFGNRDQWLGGLTVVEVADEAEARRWAVTMAEACGWPQEVRQFKASPDAG